MTDMYENTNSCEDIPQAKYVTESRKYSAEVRKAVRVQIGQYFSEDLSSYDVDRYENEILSHSVIPEGCTIVGIQVIDNNHVIKCTIPQSEVVERPTPVEVPQGKIQVIEYSPKSIAVIGETKPIKEHLKELGGKFNFRLTCGAGWIFPKTKQTEVIELLKSLKGIKEDDNKPYISEELREE